MLAAITIGISSLIEISEKRGPTGAGTTPVRETLRTPITRRIGSDYAMGASLQHGARIDTPFQAEVN